MRHRITERTEVVVGFCSTRKSKTSTGNGSTKAMWQTEKQDVLEGIRIWSTNKSGTQGR